MTYDSHGRPPAEIDVKRDLIIRPFTDFGSIAGADHTATIQAALDWSASVNGTDGEANAAVGQSGIFNVDGVIVRHGARLVNPGVTATKFVPVASPAAAAAFLMDSGPVQHVALRGFHLDMSSHPSQKGMWFRSVPILIDGATQGGLWYFDFEDVLITGCTAESLWLHGGNASLQGPIQFGWIKGLVIESASTTKPGLRISGQVGQIGFAPDCRVDGLGRSSGVQNILIERDVDTSGVETGADSYAYSIDLPVTSQSCKRIALVKRGLNISFDKAHFEEAEEGVQVEQSAGLVSIKGTYFANVGHNAGGTGFAARCDSGNLVVGRNYFGGTVDTHYIRRFGGQVTPSGGDFDDTGIRTVGITPLVNAAATIDCGFSDYVVVNPTGVTITTITSQLPVGARLTLRANGGIITLGTGGNIDLGGFHAPLKSFSETITLARNDLVGTWQVIAVSGPKGNVYPQNVFVNAAMSPYQILPATGTVRVDATSGNVTLKMPDRDLCPPGWRVNIKKLDSSTNSVFVNGYLSAQNPDGQADNVNALTKQLQSMELERNDVSGAGGWDTLSDGRNPFATLTFGTHLTGGSFDGSAPVTLATDATASNVASSLAARDASGYTAFTGVKLTVDDGVWINSVLTFYATANYSVMVGPSGYATGGRILIGKSTTDDANYYDAETHYFRNRAGYVLFTFGTSLYVHNGYIVFSTDGTGICDSVGTLRLWPTTIGASIYGNLSIASTSGSSAITVADTSGNTGISFNPANSGSSVFYDNARVGSQTVFRSSNASASDRTWLTVNAAGVAAFSWAMSVSGVLTVNTSTGVTGVDISDSSGNTGISFTPATSGDSAFIDNRRVGAHTVFRCSSSTGADRTWLTVSSAGVATFNYAATIDGVLSINTAASATGIDIVDSSGNTGISFTPASSSSVFFDNKRVGAHTFFRSSSASSNDVTWLDVFPGGSAVFGKSITCAGIVSNSDSVGSPGTPCFFGGDISGNVQFVLKPHASGDSAFFDNSRVGAQTVFRMSNASANDTTWLTVSAGGLPTFSGQVRADSVRTANPVSGSAGNWRYGSLVSASVTLAAQYVQIDIDGTAVKLAVVT